MRYFKVFLCVALVVLLLSASCFSTGALGWLRGDADGDGEITSLDVTNVQRILAGIYPDKDGKIAQRGDVTGDGLTLLDATELQRYLVYYPNVYRIGERCSDSDVSPTDDVFPTQDNQLPVIKD